MLEGPAGPAGLGGCSRERAGLVLNKRAPVDLVAVLRESAEAGGVRRGPWGYCAPMFHTRGVSGCKRAFPGSGTVSFSATRVLPF